MKVIRNLTALKAPVTKNAIVTIGVFDGVHLGHKEIITRVIERAKRLKTKSVILTFDPHPLKVLRPNYKIPTLISLNHRIKLIEDLGVDFLVILKFTKSISMLSPENFVRSILISRIGVKEVYVSRPFYFGKGARGDIRQLRNLANHYGFKVNVLRPKVIGGHIVSSSLIRRLIAEGDIHKASKFLGRRVSVFGTVVRGTSLGREIGYPTANINPHHEAIPPAGVYAVLVKHRGRTFKGVLNIGLRPTFYSPRDKEPTIEVHIFGFDKDIYGKDLEVLFIKKLRDEVKFRNRKTLILQIRKDSKTALSILR